MFSIEICMGSNCFSAQDTVLAFARKYGIPNLEWSSAGTAALRLSDATVVNFQDVRENGKLFVYLELGKLPVGVERIAYMERMLNMNTLEQGTLCGALAVDAITDTVLLQQGIVLDELNILRLEQTIVALAQYRTRIEAALNIREAKDCIQHKAPIFPHSKMNHVRSWGQAA